MFKVFMETTHELLRVVKRAAVIGGRELLKWHGRRNKLIERQKTVPSDFVTDADDASERAVLLHLHKALPNVKINAEESGLSGKGKLTIDVDALDGTMAFKHGQYYYAVSIGVRRGNKLLAGAIYLPALKQLFYATHGGGAWLIAGKRKARLRVRRGEQLKDAFIATDFNYAPEARRREHAAVHGPLLVTARYSPVYGSAAYGFTQVAAGNTSAYVHGGLKPHDSAAGLLIAREAGAKVSNFKGGQIDLASRKNSSIIAAHPYLHEQIMRLLQAKR